MKGGHNAKPTALHLVEGTFRSDRHGSAPRPAPKAPKCPSWLTAEAKREWGRVAPQLERLGLLTPLDRSALAAYCQSWARYVETQRIVDRLGTTFTTDRGQTRVRPEFRISRYYLDNARALAQQFGLTPSSRGRIEIPGAEERDDGLLD